MTDSLVNDLKEALGIIIELDAEVSRLCAKIVQLEKEKKEVEEQVRKEQERRESDLCIEYTKMKNIREESRKKLEESLAKAKELNDRMMKLNLL